MLSLRATVSAAVALLALFAVAPHADAQPRPFVRQRPVAPPRASQCLNAYGQTACGYDCRADSGEVRCANTPQGVCTAAYGRVVCWDPSPQLLWATGGQLPPARCESTDGNIACGYRCVNAYGN